MLKTMEDARQRAPFKTNSTPCSPVKNNGVGCGRITSADTGVVAEGHRRRQAADRHRQDQGHPSSPRPPGLDSAFTEGAGFRSRPLRYDYVCETAVPVLSFSFAAVAVAGCGEQQQRRDGPAQRRPRPPARRRDTTSKGPAIKVGLRHRHRGSGQPLGQLPCKHGLREGGKHYDWCGTRGGLAHQRQLRPQPQQSGKGEVRSRDRRRLPDGGCAGRLREAVPETNFAIVEDSTRRR